MYSGRVCSCSAQDFDVLPTFLSSFLCIKLLIILSFLFFLPPIIAREEAGRMNGIFCLLDKVILDIPPIKIVPLADH